MGEAARTTARAFSWDRSVARTAELYEQVHRSESVPENGTSLWVTARRRLACDMDIVGNIIEAMSDAVLTDDEEGSLEGREP